MSSSTSSQGVRAEQIWLDGKLMPWGDVRMTGLSLAIQGRNNVPAQESGHR